MSIEYLLRDNIFKLSVVVEAKGTFRFLQTTPTGIKEVKVDQYTSDNFSSFAVSPNHILAPAAVVDPQVLMRAYIKELHQKYQSVIIGQVKISYLFRNENNYTHLEVSTLGELPYTTIRYPERLLDTRFRNMEDNASCLLSLCLKRNIALFQRSKPATYISLGLLTNGIRRNVRVAGYVQTTIVVFPTTGIYTNGNIDKIELGREFPSSLTGGPILFGDQWVGSVCGQNNIPFQRIKAHLNSLKISH